MRLIALAPLIALGALAVDASAQQATPVTRPTVRGHVIDEATLREVARVRLVVTAGRDTLALGATDSAGRFVLVARHAGPAMLHLRRLGFHNDSVAVTIREVGGAPVNVALSPTSGTRLAPVLVSAAGSSAFERRARRRGAGMIFREADIQKTGASRISDVVRRVAGFSVADSNGVSLVVVSRQTSFRGVRLDGTRSEKRVVEDSTKADFDPTPFSLTPGEINSQRTRCVVRVVVDGHLMDTAFAIDDVPIAEIEGMEVFRGASGIPVEFSNTRGDASCGLIMIWRKALSSAP